MARTGSWGASATNKWFSSPVSTGITLDSDEYPNGTISVNIASGTGRAWQNRGEPSYYLNFYLCDSNGSNTIYLWKVSGFSSQYNQLYTPTSATINNSTAQKLKGQKLYVKGTGNPAYVGTYGKITITVNTAKATYGITCNTDGHGTLTSDVDSAIAGETVTLTPTPATGYQFSSYTTSPSLTITNNTFTMPSEAVTITANFTAISYAVSLVASPNAGGTVTGGGTYTYGSTVNIVATPNAGYRFVSWQATAGTIASASSASTTFTVPSSASTITATFIADSQYELNVSCMPSGGGSVTGGGAYVVNTSVTLTATANSGYQFVSWRSRDVTIANETANPITITTPAKSSKIYAYFKDTSTHIPSGDIAWTTGNGYITIQANMIKSGQSGTKQPATIKIYLGVIE